MIRRRNINSVVHWKMYLDPTTNEYVRRFLKENGKRVFSDVHQTINDANTKKINELMLLVHPNASSVILIEENEYAEVLDVCLEYFKSIEDYSKCSEISQTITKINKGFIK